MPRGDVEANGHPHVFLGGYCGPMPGWRQLVAIPLLEAAGITYYDPQVPIGTWHNGLIKAEAVAKEGAVQLLVPVGPESRGTVSLLEAMEYACFGSFVHFVIADMVDGTVVEGQVVTGADLKDANRGRAYLRSLLARRRPHLPIHASIEDAVKAIIIIASAYGVGRGLRPPATGTEAPGHGD